MARRTIVLAVAAPVYFAFTLLLENWLLFFIIAPENVWSDPLYLSVFRDAFLEPGWLLFSAGFTGILVAMQAVFLIPVVRRRTPAGERGAPTAGAAGTRRGRRRENAARSAGFSGGIDFAAALIREARCAMGVRALNVAAFILIRDASRPPAEEEVQVCSNGSCSGDAEHSVLRGNRNHGRRPRKLG